MKNFNVSYDTDVGIKKKTNQDSILLKGGAAEKEELLLAVICDGMGGMEKGELASATVVRAFSDWFENDYMNSSMTVSDEMIKNSGRTFLKMSIAD